MFNKLSKNILANALRFLSIDAIQLANSGHPGMPMGMADLAEVLWNDFLVHNPINPNWINRDRFIVSNGHGSMLYYALLHLTGYNLSIEDLKQFRKLHSKTPGHPEYKITPGVEATTGPLGQGIGMAVGMAIAEKLLANAFNRKDLNIVDHYTYCFAGDGCLMEGVSHEVCSLAGTLGLNKLILFWDNNQISIDGKTDRWFSEDLAKRFAGYNWNIIEVNGHDAKQIRQAIEHARSEQSKPTLLCCKTIIGYGSLKLSGTERSHGSPLGETEVAAVREYLGWEYPAFYIPKEIYASWNATVKGVALNNLWDQKITEYATKEPELFKEFNRRCNSLLPSSLEETINSLIKTELTQPLNIATRQASKKILDCLANELPELLGGSADLSNSNLTLFNNAKILDFNTSAKIFNYLHYGVREFGMSCIMNGLSLHKGFIPYGGTFLVFADYAKAGLRSSAMMEQPVIYVLSHDSIGVGEDGPTHQPIEQLAMLRTIPNMSVWRPCDTIETIIAWQIAITETSKPSCIVLSRQTVIQQERSEFMIDQIKYGGYILRDAENIEAIIIATGSEVSLAILASEELIKKYKIFVRVVSMPNMNIFLQQSEEYQQQILPDHIINRVAVEAGNTFIWHKFVGLNGRVIGLDRFGLSGSAIQVYQYFDITVETIKRTVLELLKLSNNDD